MLKLGRSGVSEPVSEPPRQLRGRLVMSLRAGYSARASSARRCLGLRPPAGASPQVRMVASDSRGVRWQSGSDGRVLARPGDRNTSIMIDDRDDVLHARHHAQVALGQPSKGGAVEPGVVVDE